MGENSINLGEGQLYIDGNAFSGRLETASVEAPADAEEFKGKATSLTGLAASFEAVAEISRAAMIAMLGLENAVALQCHNSRVRHLVRHARKHRTKKKNIRRAFKIIEKEAEQWK